MKKEYTMLKRNGISFFTAALLTLLIASCGKDEPLSPYVPDDSGDFKYKITGLKDTSLERTGEVRYLIAVEKEQGQAQSVTLSTEGLPKGMEVLFEPVNGEKASYNTTIIIKNTRVPEGVHKINIRGASITTGISNYYINVNVLPYTNAAIGLVGTFTETGQCSKTGNVNDNVNIVADEIVKNRIHIKGLFSGVMTNEIYADINPADKTLTIPSQVVNDLTYKGDGTYDDDKLVINYTMNGDVINNSCSSTLARN
ncbi:MAG: hypothetical protein H3C54_03185 [Taibaiella sp.]|nr:hypothetical protein [Taibaiella sp.]